MNRRRASCRMVQTLVVVAVCAATSLVHADVVAVKGRPPMVNVQVIAFRDGSVIAREAAGRAQEWPLAQVEYLQIGNWSLFNLAEKQRRAEDWHRATVSYEKALADLQAPAEAGKGPPGYEGFDARTLIRCRLVQAWDAQGRLDRAVEHYLAILPQLPNFKALQPSHMPPAGSSLLTDASRQIDVFLQGRADDGLRRALLEWRSTWPAAASQPAPATGPAQPDEPGAAVKAELLKVRSLVEMKRPDEAFKRLDSLDRIGGSAVRPEIAYWRGRAFEQPMAGESPEQAQVRRGRAGLAYMRVVILAPTHELAAECLFRAGELCRASGRREQAVTLWTELTGRYPQATPWADQAREAMK